MGPRWRALAEIDENLIRRDLTPAQRAKPVAKRKAAYEAVHPETKNGATGRGRPKVGQVGQAIARFTADTAAKTGTPERSIRRDATRAKALGPDLDRVAGTSLDKGAELDALAAMQPADRQSLIARAVAGERVREAFQDGAPCFRPISPCFLKTYDEGRSTWGLLSVCWLFARWG